MLCFTFSKTEEPEESGPDELVEDGLTDSWRQVLRCSMTPAMSGNDLLAN
jgi:hypothetical protein